MTDPFARPPGQQPDDSDPTVPLVPDSGYAPASQPPFGEETLVDPLGNAGWDTPAQEFGYTPTPGWPGSAPSAPGPTTPARGYDWPSAGAPGYAEPNYVQPDLGGPVSAYQAYPPAAAAPWTAAPPVPYHFSEPVPPEHPNATPALVLGILGIVGFWPLGPVAWFLGAKGRRDIRRNPGRWRSSGTLTAGVVLGAITTTLLALTAFAITMFVLLVIARSS